MSSNLSSLVIKLNNASNSNSSLNTSCSTTTSQLMKNPVSCVTSKSINTPTPFYPPPPPPRTTILPLPFQMIASNHSSMSMTPPQSSSTPESGIYHYSNHINYLNSSQNSNNHSSANSTPAHNVNNNRVQKSLVISTSSNSSSASSTVSSSSSSYPPSTSIHNNTVSTSISFKVPPDSPIHHLYTNSTQSSSGTSRPPIATGGNAISQSPVSMTTEEEFKKMESAVNNLLVSKKQIDMLKSERSSLIKFYETKLLEQNEQIKYLQDENYRLKSLVASLVKGNQIDQSTVNEHINNGRNNPGKLSRPADEEMEQKNWCKKYEQCIDNIIKQLLNSMRIQDAIRNEYMRLNEQQLVVGTKQQQQQASSASCSSASSTSASSLDSNHMNGQNSKEVDVQNNMSNDSLETKMKAKRSRRNRTESDDKEKLRDQALFKTSNSWTYNEQLSGTQSGPALQVLSNLMVEQKKQQLNLIGELNSLSKSLKPQETQTSNSNRDSLVSQPKDHLDTHNDGSSSPSLKSSSSVFAATTTNTAELMSANKASMTASATAASANASNKNVCYYLVFDNNNTVVTSNGSAKNHQVVHKKFVPKSHAIEKKPEQHSSNKPLTTPSTTKSTPESMQLNMSSTTSLNGSSSVLNKPSKIPKYNIARNGSVSSATSSSSNFMSHQANKSSSVDPSARVKYLAVSSKIPQRQPSLQPAPRTATDPAVTSQYRSRSTNSSNLKVKATQKAQNDEQVASKKSSSSNARNVKPVTSSAQRSAVSNNNNHHQTTMVQNSNPNYNTYIVKNKVSRMVTNASAPNTCHGRNKAPIIDSRSPKTSQALVNSATFDKGNRPSHPIPGEQAPEDAMINNNDTESLLIMSLPLDRIKGADDEGYSSLSSQLTPHMKIIIAAKATNNAKSSPHSHDTSSTTSSSDKNNDSGIRISTTSAESSADSSSPNNTGASCSSSASDDSPSSSSTHSPHLKPSNNENAAVTKKTSVSAVAAAVVASAISNIQSNDQLMVRSSSSIASSIKPILLRNKKRVKKRYCFPTLKSFSYYYNNRYYHKCNEDIPPEEGAEVCENPESRARSSEQNSLCVKYLSDTDVATLANQLSAYDKDLSYNVYHLDTLYNNVDYILFNSYASDTELVYNYNRRHGRNQHFLNSNYKLYINDYFNQAYDDEGENDEENSQPTGDSSIVKSSDDEQSDCHNGECKARENGERSLADYELTEDERLRIAEQYDNMMNNTMGTTSNEEDGYEYLINNAESPSNNQFQYDDYENENSHGSGYGPGTCYSTGDIDGLLFDDDDVNLLLIMNEVNQKMNPNDEELANNPNIFATMSHINSAIFTSPSLSSISSSSSDDSHPSHSSSSSSTESTSNDDDSFKKFKRIKTKKTKKSESDRSPKRHRRHHRHSRRHEYFVDNEVDEKLLNGKVGLEFKNPNFSYLPESDQSNPNDQTDFMDEKFDIDEFVQQLELQCSIDNRILECRKSAKRLKELNRIAAAQVVKAVAQKDTSLMIDENSSHNHHLYQDYHQLSSPVHHPHLVRRHTITAMPSAASAVAAAGSMVNNPRNKAYYQQNASANAKASTILSAASPILPSQVSFDRGVDSINKTVKPEAAAVAGVFDSKAFVGSYTTPSSLNGTPMHARNQRYVNGHHLDENQVAASPLAHAATTLPLVASTPIAANGGVRNSNTVNSIVASACGSYNQGNPNAGCKSNLNNCVANQAGYDFSPCKVNFNSFNNDFYRLCSDTFFCGSDSNLNNAAAFIQTRSSSKSSINNLNDMIDYDELTPQQKLMLQQQHQQKQQAAKNMDSLAKPAVEKFPNGSQQASNVAAYQTNLTAHVNTLFDQWLMQNNGSAAATADSSSHAIPNH